MAASSDTVAHLYIDHHGWLKGWLRKKFGCSETAADVAQDTFVRVLQAGTASQLLEPRAYLSRIASGLVVDHFRRRTIERSYLEVLASRPEGEHPSLEDQAIIIESLVRIEAMLAGLKPKVRETFLLSQLEGLTYPQIAERLSISPRSVSNYMAIALDQCFELAPWSV